MSQEPRNQNYPDPANQPPTPDWRMIAWVVVTLMLVFLFIDVSGERQVEVLSYTQFKQEVRTGAVNEVTIRGQEIRGRLDPSPSATTAGVQEEPGVTGTSDQGASGSDGAITRFRTTMPSFDDSHLMPLLEENAVVG